MIDINVCIAKAMKSKNKAELRAYKNLKSEIQLLQTAKNAKPYDEASEINLISKMVKKLEDDIQTFSEAHRDDLASEYREELVVLKKLLPEPVDESEIEYILYNWADEENMLDYFSADLPKIIIPRKDMGRAIKHLKSRFPQVDGKIISEIVKKFVV